MNGPNLFPAETVEQSRVVRHGSHRRVLTWALPLLTLLFAAVSIVLLSHGFRMLRAISTLAFLNRKPRPLRIYDRFFAHRVNITDLTVPGTLGPIAVRIFTPLNKTNPIPIVMIHGLVPYGNRDGYLGAVAQNLGEMGYMVVVPNIPAETQYEMLPSDLSVIGDAIRWTAQTTGQKVAAFGVSFGGGLVIPAALQPSVKTRVKLIFSLSGYYNLESIARYYMHDRVTDPGGHAYLGMPPGPLLITAPFLKELVPPQELPSLQRELDFLKRSQGRRLTGDDPSSDLTPDEVRMLHALEAVDNREVHGLYMEILRRHHGEFAALSPASVVHQLNVPLYVIHGKYDPIFPEGEIEWMKKDLAGNRLAHILVTPCIGHAVIDQPATLGDKLQLASFGAQLLSALSDRVDLPN